MPESKLDVSVVICTRNRAESLHETLACLTAADRRELAVEIVVVDNGSTDPTRGVAESFAGGFRLRYLFEATTGTYGKSHALNCALATGGLGEIVAVLDDDMNVAKDWYHGVMALSRRWPDASFFTGRSYVIWPSGPVPTWAGDPKVVGWLCSVLDNGEKDHPLRSGRWFSGNQFWFRSGVLGPARRFSDTWFTEPQFMLQLVEDGYYGVSGPDARAGHRIQPRLLNPTVAMARSVQTGVEIARTRLCPYRKTVRNAQLAVARPVIARAYCVAAWLRWSRRCWQTRMVDAGSARFAAKLEAVQQQANYREALRILGAMDPYRIFRWSHRAHSRY
jgi:glycosyltransferase involved in cell wall biosynthesis